MHSLNFIDSGSWCQARFLADYAILHKDGQSGFFWYTSDASQLIVRKMEISDQVIPSSNSTMADVLYKLGHYYQEDSYVNMSSTMTNHVARVLFKTDRTTPAGRVL